MTKQSPDIVCLGEPLVEFNQINDQGHYLFGHGGDTSNCAIAAARAGASVGYITALGQDEFGDSFMRLWAENGVDASQVSRRADAHTGVYFVTHGPDGHVFSYLRAGSAASRMTPEQLPRDYIAGARVLHVSGISMAISASAADAVFEAIEIARNAGVLVSFDTNLRLRLWPIERARAITEAAMRKCDIALPGLEDANQLIGVSDPDVIADHYLEGGAKVVALTLGQEGCLVATPDERRRVAGIKVKAVDATAAGDTFDGNFLAEYLRHGDPFEAARFANAAAALSTQGYGAVAPMPRREEVEAALKG
ncbi:2-dehydro-3-deoxygluconokinase [Nitratireductor aestuarii]|uniref:2-dehydro-3-deoxygluconokinase n=1 Tax=Nitratireductor aestuarii TaxID=1735103 RepID=A0A916W331_9HYPH|nr:sugar kinase [Nitratireductor aestuarii]GGA62332.1 2-dehydro-3-deoxygluconokinase [Nitratireductor aestuarii]